MEYALLGIAWNMRKRLNGYFSKPVSCNYSGKIFRYSPTIGSYIDSILIEIDTLNWVLNEISSFELEATSYAVI
jgi:hypothetical protein